MSISEREVLIWLSSIDGVKHAVLERLTEYLGSINNIWTASDDMVRKALKNNSIIAERMIKNKSEHYFYAFADKLRTLGITASTVLDSDYPQQLRGIYDLPYVIYLKGSGKIEGPLVSIVGARRASPYGLWAAKYFACELSRFGIGTVSGLALGVDTAAHKGAIEAGGKTIAVLGCGAELCYPSGNRSLYDNIVNCSGTIISEYPPGTQPLKHHFPARNRIISGLSEGIILVEAGERSGALITVEFGLEQGKEIYAVPGNINSSGSKGTNRLIREGAKILTSIEDILEDLSHKYSIRQVAAENMHKESLSHIEAEIFKIISLQPIHIDLIVLKSGVRINELNSILSILEIKGLVCQLPGKIFTVN